MSEQSPSRPGTAVVFRKAVESYHRIRKVMACRLRQVDISAAPYFDEASTAYFREQLERAETYLEYGSGGSTVFANQRVKVLVSVDSDPHFLAAVARRLDADNAANRARRPAAASLIHADIGLTTDWGMPAFTRHTRRRVRRWADYPAAPWRYLRSISRQPDLILVDGRFRVACVLESLLNLEPLSQCQILLDDYISRPHYHIVERLCETRRVGRMAVLQLGPSCDRNQCRSLLEQYRTDPR